MHHDFATLMLLSNCAAARRRGSAMRRPVAAMRRTVLRRLAVSAWLLVALHVLSFGANSAVASCGDYVAMGRHDSASHMAPAPGPSASQSFDAVAQQSASGKKSPCADGQCSNPCRNGRCHRAPAGLPAGPTSQITLSIQQWALLAAVMVDDSPRCAFRFITDSGVVASGYPPSIDHPPQNLFL